MIVLKNLAREFNLDPHALRKLLRQKFNIPKGRRWAYEEKSKELKKVREYLSSLKNSIPYSGKSAPKKSATVIRTSASKTSSTTSASATKNSTRGSK